MHGIEYHKHIQHKNKETLTLKGNQQFYPLASSDFTSKYTSVQISRKFYTVKHTPIVQQIFTILSL